MFFTNPERSHLCKFRGNLFLAIREGRFLVNSESSQSRRVIFANPGGSFFQTGSFFPRILILPIRRCFANDLILVSLFCQPGGRFLFLPFCQSGRVLVLPIRKGHFCQTRWVLFLPIRKGLTFADPEVSCFCQYEKVSLLPFWRCLNFVNLDESQSGGVFFANRKRSFFAIRKGP